MCGGDIHRWPLFFSFPATIRHPSRNGLSSRPSVAGIGAGVSSPNPSSQPIAGNPENPPGLRICWTALRALRGFEVLARAGGSHAGSIARQLPLGMRRETACSPSSRRGSWNGMSLAQLSPGDWLSIYLPNMWSRRNRYLEKVAVSWPSQKCHSLFATRCRQTKYVECCIQPPQSFCSHAL